MEGPDLRCFHGFCLKRLLELLLWYCRRSLKYLQNDLSDSHVIIFGPILIKLKNVLLRSSNPLTMHQHFFSLFRRGCVRSQQHRAIRVCTGYFSYRIICIATTASEDKWLFYCNSSISYVKQRHKNSLHISPYVKSYLKATRSASYVFICYLEKKKLKHWFLIWWRLYFMVLRSLRCFFWLVWPDHRELSGFYDTLLVFVLTERLLERMWRIRQSLSLILCILCLQREYHSVEPDAQ